MAGRAGSHYTPAGLSSTSVKIPKIEIPDSLCSTGWASSVLLGHLPSKNKFESTGSQYKYSSTSRMREKRVVGNILIKAPTIFAQLFLDMFSFSSQPQVHIVRRSPKKLNFNGPLQLPISSHALHFRRRFNKQICSLVMYEHRVKSCKLSGQNSV
jgi:hypothetical protein